MDRPTCASCIYWECREDDVFYELGAPERKEFDYAPCIFNAPPSTLEPPGADWDGRESSRMVMRPTMWGHEVCGRHPDFPAYIEYLKQQKLAKLEADVHQMMLEEYDALQESNRKAIEVETAWLNNSLRRNQWASPFP